MLLGLSNVIDWLFMILEYAILARVIISWIPVPRDNQIVILLYKVTDPILEPIKRLIEKSSMGKNIMIDFSPIIAFLLIGLVRNIVRRFI